MDNDIEKIIAEQLKTLPVDVARAISSVDYKAKLRDITRRQRLLIDQAAKLEMETTLVMIGLEPLKDFIINLQKNMEVPEVRAKEIALDVSESIFKPIRQSLEKMDESMYSTEEGTETNSVETNNTNNTEEAPIRFTNSNEAELNRDQILNEIQNPNTIKGGSTIIDFTTKPKIETMPSSQTTDSTTPTKEIEIRPEQTIEIIQNQEVKDIKKSTADILETKMTNPTIVSQQVVEKKPLEESVPAVKRRPSSGVDPYREPVI